MPEMATNTNDERQWSNNPLFYRQAGSIMKGRLIGLPENFLKTRATMRLIKRSRKGRKILPSFSSSSSRSRSSSSSSSYWPFHRRRRAQKKRRRTTKTTTTTRRKTTRYHRRRR